MNEILHGDSLELLKDLDENSIDSIVTDPPYGYDFMGKDWDKAVPSVEMWEECLRVLKPGGFAFIMSAPRADVQGEMIKRLEKAGFRVDFTPVYWTYATGFPKATNIAKMVDKRLGVKGEVVGKKSCGYQVSISKTRKEQGYRPNETNATTEVDITEPSSDEAKALNGSYCGYQPKPAIEVIIVVMKPLSEKSYIDQAMKNGKGVTWLDDMRIPFKSDDVLNNMKTTKRKPRPDDSTWSNSGFKSEANDTAEANPKGRFAANLIVQDDVLNDGKNRKSTGGLGDINVETKFGQTSNRIQKPFNYQDEGSFSRYYDLDAWWKERIQDLPLNVQATYPFMIVPKASKSEKNKGCEGMEEKQVERIDQLPDGFVSSYGNVRNKPKPVTNFHPTVKPISLMSYLVTLGSREGEVVLDPFVGSGTTCIATKLLNRNYIGMEMNDEYVVIAEERIKSYEPDKKEHNFF